MAYGGWYLGKRSAIYGRPSTSRVAVIRDPAARYPWGSYMYRSYAEFWSLMIPLPPLLSFLFFLILGSILTMAVKFIAIARQEISRSSSFPSLSRALFNLVPKTRLHFRGMNGDSRTRGRGETIKQFPTVRDAIYRTVMASGENPTAIKWSATGVFYGRRKNVVMSISAFRPEVLRLLISHVAKQNHDSVVILSSNSLNK